MKSGGDSNTIQVVNDVRNLTAHLFDLPKQLVTNIVFDQSVFVKEAINTVLHEGVTGLVLIGVIILVFLGSGRATSAVLLSIPISTHGRFRGVVPDGQQHQHHDPGRPGAGVLARDRQLGDLTRKHLPPSGNGRVARGRGGAGRL